MESKRKNQLGINLINLLRIKGINQSKLAKDTEINKRCISDIINGKREPSENEQKKISAYFNKSYEVLLHDDFSQLTDEKKDPDDFYRKWDILFPLFLPKKSSTNPHFRKAYDEQQYLYAKLRNLDYHYGDVDEDLILEEYGLAAEDKKIEYETFANILAMFFFLIIGMKTATVLSPDFDSLPLDVKAELERNEKKLVKYERNQELFEGTKQGYRGAIEDVDFNEILAECYTKLKRNAKWGELADYYICLQYFFDAVPNAFSDVQNRDYGLDLLCTYAYNCGNKYAAQYIDIMINS